MQKPMVRRGLGLLQTGVLLLAGMALADGGARTGVTSDPVTARVTFQCQGGVRVQVTQRTRTVRVDFAGKSRTLNLTGNSSGTIARNPQVSWVTQGAVASMRNNASGGLELSGCRPVG